MVEVSKTCVGQKALFMSEGQRNITGLLWADKKAVTEINNRYTQSMQKSISEKYNVMNLKGAHTHKNAP